MVLGRLPESGIAAFPVNSKVLLIKSVARSRTAVSFSLVPADSTLTSEMPLLTVTIILPLFDLGIISTVAPFHS